MFNTAVLHKQFYDIFIFNEVLMFLILLRMYHPFYVVLFIEFYVSITTIPRGVD